MDERRFSITARDLYASLYTDHAPTVVDVRSPAAYAADETMLAGAIRRFPTGADGWRAALRRPGPVVVYCVHGHEVSQDIAAAMREVGIDASYLAGGLAEWSAKRLPSRRKIPMSGRWVTRERPKVDRVACPWLVRRFIDPDAQFSYEPADRVLGIARETGAIAYDMPGAEPFAHDGERCSFDGFIDVFGIEDEALDRLALIVRGADTDRVDLTPESPGLLALSRGLSINYAHDDHAMLAHAMTIYDALYVSCREARRQTVAFQASE